jgi:hypothetical protein
MAKARVIVDTVALVDYLNNGYVEIDWPADIQDPPPGHRQGLHVMEVAQEKRARLNQPERAYRLVGSNYTTVCRMHRIEQVDVLERGEWAWMVEPVGEAGDDFNGAYAEEANPETLYATRRECAAGEAASMREKVRLLREAADNLEEFMVRIECPPAGEKE